MTVSRIVKGCWNSVVCLQLVNEAVKSVSDIGDAVFEVVKRHHLKSPANLSFHTKENPVSVPQNQVTVLKPLKSLINRLKILTLRLKTSNNDIHILHIP